MTNKEKFSYLSEIPEEEVITPETKERIVELRERKLSYKAIARITHLPVRKVTEIAKSITNT